MDYKSKDGKDLSVSLLMPKSERTSFFPDKKGMDLSSLFPIIQGNPIPKTISLVCSVSDLPCVIPQCPNKAAD